MLHLQRRHQDALLRLRTAVISQEHALAEQMSQRNLYRGGEDDRGGAFQEDFKGGGGSVGGSDTKKRRGVSRQFESCGTRSSNVLTALSCRKQHLQAAATAVTAPKRPNGDGGRTGLARCATPADYTTPN